MTEVKRERGFVVKDEPARIEFSALVEKLGHGAYRQHITMSREEADKMSDQELLAEHLDPATFRAMITARERMVGNGVVGNAQSIWQRSNEKLFAARAGENHGQL